MCGICGKFDPAGVRMEDVRQMCDQIVHRGPDEDGYYVNGAIGLGSRRLSIIDLPGGRQPIPNEDETLWIVFNGEIYNYKSLREGLVNRGHEFRTHSDTEVILHLYEEMGERCLDELRGMFAIAIWDTRRQRLFLARDRLGQKPLFYAQLGRSLLFGSEIKALLASDEVGREVDFTAAHHYLSLRFIPPPKTMFQGISKLPAGHYLTFEDGQVRVERYWELNFRDKSDMTEDRFVEQLRALMEETVESHLVSDVPVGAFLSGGMDSSTIVAMMAKSHPDPFKTFTVGVEEQSFNEIPFAKIVADYYGTDHHEEIVQSNLIDLLPRMVWHLDEPSDPIAANMFHAADLASKHVKVVLGGDGGDELFAGFDRYIGVQYLGMASFIPSLLHERVFRPIINSLPENFGYKSLSQKLRWVNQLATIDSAGDRYAAATSFFRFNHQEKGLLFQDNPWQQLKELRSNRVISDTFNHPNAGELVDQMLYADYMTRLPEHSLMLTDRMTMAYSLEARSPLLDHHLVEFLAAAPTRLKIRRRTLKYALREVAKGILPPEIVNRPKQGFMFPIAKWFGAELYPFIRSYLLDSALVREGIFRHEAVDTLLQDHRASKRDNHVRLWMLLNLEVWHQMFIQRASVQDVGERIRAYR